MKKISILLTLCLVFFSSCKIKSEKPDCYSLVQDEFNRGNYERVLEILNTEKIPARMKTDWFYYDYGMSLYKTNRLYTCEGIKNLYIAYNFNPENYYTLYFLGKMYFEISEYKKSYKYFLKASKVETDECINSESFSAKEWTIYLDKMFNSLENRNCDEKEFAKEIENIIDDSSYEDFQKILELELACDIENLEQNIKVLEFFTGIADRKEIRNFIKVKLLYAYELNENFANAEKIISELLNENSHGIKLLETEYPIVAEKFYKYCCFYYYLLKDYGNANKYFRMYENTKYRPLGYTIEYSLEISNLLKKLKNDKEFKRLL